MSKPKAPTPPDPTATIAAQTQSNLETAKAGNEMNRVNQYGPTGSITYDNPTGNVWNQTTTESANQRQLREGQEGLGIGLNNLAGSQISKVSDILGTNFNPRRFNSSEVTGGAFDPNKAAGADIEDSVYKLATDRLGKQFDRSEESLRTRLANQGVNAGTDAFGAEMESFNEGRGNAYSEAQLMARGQAEASRAARIGEQLGARQQNLAEGEADYSRNYSADLAARQTPLNEISAIMSGTPLQGFNPASYSTQGVSNTDVAGITQGGFNNQQQNYQQQMGARNAMLGGLFGLGGAALGNTSLLK